MMKMKRLFFCILLFTQWNIIHAQDYFSNWPKGASPKEIGDKVAQRFVSLPYAPYANGEKPHITYYDVCAWYGALTFSKLTNNTALKNKLIERFQPLFNKDSSLLPVPDHVDYNVFGTIPFEIYMQTKEKKYLTLGRFYADKQWDAPEGPRVIPASYTFYSNGYTWQTRLWIDDMYMITMVQSQAYRATHDKKYIDHSAKEMVMYLDSLQQPNGLFFHANDAHFYWGRGNGWMAAGMTELLRSLPKSNPNYARIMKGYKTMMASLLQYQAEDGMWRQLINDSESWKETSSTGMFTFAMITGVKNGWLDKNIYGKAARKAWLALITYINPDGDITNVCEGTGKNYTRQYYLDRKRLTGDYHGQAPVLWCATALLRGKDK